MRRREVIRLICSAAAVWPLVVRAQQLDRVRRIRVLIAQAESDREAQSWVAAFREELRKLGWTEGRNIEINTRWARGDVESMKLFCPGTRGASTRPHFHEHYPSYRGDAATDKNDPHNFRVCWRSCRQRFRREP